MNKFYIFVLFEMHGLKKVAKCSKIMTELTLFDQR